MILIKNGLTLRCAPFSPHCNFHTLSRDEKADFPLVTKNFILENTVKSS